MAEIKPFRGYIYNTEKVGDIAKVLAPPYDVISPEMQDSLYKRSDFNIVRLILGKEEPGDNEVKNKYKRAKVLLEDFIAKGILIKDELPSIYVYEQDYTVSGEKKSRIGFTALMRLEDPKTSKVLPHEHTFTNTKKDRLRLIRQVKANPCPIFSIFEDDKGKITNILEKETKKEPIFDIYYEEVRQKLWRVSNPKIISSIKKKMKGKKIFIADGHHRYEVALAFRDEMRAKTKKKQSNLPYDFVLMYFAGLDEAKLTILATHRLIKDIGGLTREKILGLLGRYFNIREYKNFSDMRLTQENSGKDFIFGMYCGGNFYYLLELKDISIADKIMKTDKPTEWKRLDVTLLHQFIFKHILKINDNDDSIIYLKDAETALKKVKSGEAKMIFFLNPTRLGQVKKIAQIGEKMPYKSTYFYPKLLSGIVINKFD